MGNSTSNRLESVRRLHSVSSWNFAVDTSTVDGRKALSFLLTAYTAGKAVNIAGTGSCSLWGDTENLLYAYFSY